MGSVPILALLAALQVPFVPQAKDTCGAAALAMVMQYHGRDIAQETIVAQILEPELRGIRGSRLAEFARGHDMVAIAFAGELSLVREHLGKGRPLVLALSAGRDRFHDVVAVGYDDARRELIVHDPALGPARRIGERELERRWAEAGHWTLLVQERAEPRPEPRDAASEPGVPEPAGPAPAATASSPLPPAAGVGYDELVVRAVALGRSGSEAEAAEALDRAVALAPGRPEAWTERGGLRFLGGRYEEAVSDLRRSLSVREDPYARNLLGASLHLAGRELEALAAWNRIGKPTLGRVEIGGLRHTRDEVARRELELVPGQTLTRAGLAGARRRLEETGVFDRVTLRPKPLGDGVADLEVSLAERHGLASGPAAFLVTTGVNLAWQRLRLRYSNLGGTGTSLGGSLRWQERRPEAVLQLSAPRPFGLPGYGRLAVFASEQGYELGQPLEVRRSGVELGFRSVLDGGSVLSLGVRQRSRSLSRPHPDAAPGRSVGLEVGLERRLVESRRQRLNGVLRVQLANPLLGSELEYLQADAELRYEGVLSRPEGRSVERSLIALRLRAGWGSDGLPLDEMYAPGVSPESDLPLRAHPLTRRGAIGANPVGRSVSLLNAEWRHSLVHRRGFDLGAAVFCDAAHVSRVAAGSAARSLVDAGVGVRLSLLAGPTLRIDHAWGLRDGRRALFVGLNQAF